MAHRRLVTVVGATGAQGGAVVRSLIGAGKYKVTSCFLSIVYIQSNFVDRFVV